MRSGFVTILGNPNAGKSTLLNALIGEKVAIVTNKPQTTRTQIKGIAEVPGGRGKRPAAQVVFVDTPGVQHLHSQLDRRMMHEVESALSECDLAILLVDASQKLPQAEPPARSGEANERERTKPAHGTRGDRTRGKDGGQAAALALLNRLQCPVFLVLNKIDLVSKDRLLPLIAQLNAAHPFAEVLLISALHKNGLDRLMTKIVERLPEGRRHFPKDQFTDQPERFLVAELIRERILLETGEEVPYASAVVVEQFEEPGPSPGRSPGAPRKGAVTHIAAAIYCERSGQKAILIGKGGAKLKGIGTAARKEIEAMLGRRVYLELRVIVEERWRESRAFVESLTWRKQLENLSLDQGQSGKPEKPKPG